MKTTPLFKRITSDALSEYLPKGWQIHRREGRTIVLIWTKGSTPP